MNNKKGVMFLASILILIFHLWINSFNNYLKIEMFIRQICFIGVDIFFFLSAYSLSKSNIKNYKGFIISRFINVYLVFIIFSIINYFLTNWSIIDLLLTITGINLFIKGGGSFLWFIPSIMIIYILLPIYKRIDNKKTLFITILIWFLLTILISTLTTYKSIFIFTNRIPIILLGYYSYKYKLLNISKLKYYSLTITLFILGLYIMYNTISVKITYIKDIYYLLSIPLSLSIIMFIDKIPNNKLVNVLGSLTLEMYCIQMTLGFKLASYIYKQINIPLLSNIITFTIIIFLSLVIHYMIPKRNIYIKKID